MKDLDSAVRKALPKLLKAIYKNEMPNNISISLTLSQIADHMREMGIQDFDQYLFLVGRQTQHLERLHSILLNNTTFFFREVPHFQRLDTLLSRWADQSYHFSMLCVGCSSGQEAYSFAMVLSDFQQRHSGFEYSIKAVDIDSVSLERARKATYPVSEKAAVVERFWRYLVELPPDHFTILDKVRERVQFERGNALEMSHTLGRFDMIVCRNMLIYYNESQIKSMLLKFKTLLKPEGRIVLGHCEHIAKEELGLQAEGNAIYTLKTNSAQVAKTSVNREAVQHLKIALISTRKEGLRRQRLQLDHAGYPVISISDPEEMLMIMRRERPRLWIFDYDMPDADAFVQIKKLRFEDRSTPILLALDKVQKFLVEESFSMGIQEILKKNDSPEAFLNTIRSYTSGVLRNYTRHDAVVTLRKPLPLVLIGSSTGGPDALTVILDHIGEMIGPSCPPILLVQHLEQQLASGFAEKLAELSCLKLAKLEQGQAFERGHLYIPTGDYHLGVAGGADSPKMTVVTSGKISGHQPAVDFLFNAACSLPDSPILAMLLSGMGSDGAEGMKRLSHLPHACTLAQDEQSCVVYGMPAKAMALGGVEFMGSPQQLQLKLLQFCQQHGQRDLAVATPMGHSLPDYPLAAAWKKLA